MPTDEERAAFKRAELHRTHVCPTCEAEAVTAALDALAAEVAGLEPCCDEAAVTLSDGRTLRAMCQHGGYVRDAVLAAIEKARP